MKMNQKILSIPPYISTSWKNIASLHVENKHAASLLIVTLLNGVKIEVPQLSPPILDAIFKAHALFLEQEEKTIQPKAPPITAASQPIPGGGLISLELPIKNSLAELREMGTLLQHNPQEADSPNLPSEVLEKITQLSKTMGIDDPNAAPKPEPHCNCIHCQIAKAMQEGFQKEEIPSEEPEEIVSDDELKFCSWDIKQTEDKLYCVTNRLDEKEHYHVYLGEPIGCTCGQAHCEHIRAVLNS